MPFVCVCVFVESHFSETLAAMTLALLLTLAMLCPCLANDVTLKYQCENNGWTCVVARAESCRCPVLIVPMRADGTRWPEIGASGHLEWSFWIFSLH